MAKYIVKRVIMALITILVVACVTFVLMMSVPGSPFNDEKITPEQKAAMEAKYGMDDPLGVQMLRYLKGVIVDQDFGVSLKMQKDRPVLDIITEKFPLSARSASSPWYGPWRWAYHWAVWRPTTGENGWTASYGWCVPWVCPCPASWWPPSC